jgi:hypothetical protein
LPLPAAARRPEIALELDAEVNGLLEERSRIRPIPPTANVLFGADNGTWPAAGPRRGLTFMLAGHGRRQRDVWLWY